MTNGMSAIAWHEIRGMIAAVHENRAEAVSAAGFKDVEALRFAIIEELCAIGGRHLARAGRWFTANIRLVSNLNAIIEECSCPRLKWNLAELRLGCHERIGRLTRIRCKQT